MKETQLGELEELILLAILSEGNKAHGLAIQEKLLLDINRKISRGSLHTVLARLEEKAYLTSAKSDPTPTRGGKSKRVYSVSNAGMGALSYAKTIRDRYYKTIPVFQFSWG